jgi:hypothetical protein
MSAVIWCVGLSMMLWTMGCAGSPEQMPGSLAISVVADSVDATHGVLTLQVCNNSKSAVFIHTSMAPYRIHRTVAGEQLLELVKVPPHVLVGDLVSLPPGRSISVTLRIDDPLTATRCVLRTCFGLKREDFNLENRNRLDCIAELPIPLTPDGQR